MKASKIILTVSFIINIITFIVIFTDKFETKENSDSPVIIWNDDPESIPIDGELVKLEFTENDTLYIGNK